MTEREKIKRELFEFRTIETAKLDHKIFALRKSVSLELFANNCEQANALLTEIGDLERRKQTLREKKKPEESQ